MIKSFKSIYPYLLIDFIIYAGTFVLLFFTLERSLKWEEIYLTYFVPFLLSGGAASVITRKFSFGENDYSPTRFYYSFILMLGIFSAYSFFVKAIEVPRFILLSSLLVSLLLELLWIRIFIAPSGLFVRQSRTFPSPKIFLFYFVLLNLSFFAFFLEHFSLKFLGLQHLYLAGVYVSWFVSVKITFNYSFSKSTGYWRFIWSHIKSYILLSAMALFLLFILKFNSATNFAAVEGIIIYNLVAFLVTSYYFLSKIQSDTDEVAPSVFKAPVLNIEEMEGKLSGKGKYSLKKDVCRSDDLLTKENSDLSRSVDLENKENGQGPVEYASHSTGQVERKLRDVYLKSNPEIFERLSHKLDLNCIDITQMVVLRSRDEFNVDVLPENSLQLFMNLHELNDIRRLNAYLITVNKRLVDGGIFVGRVEPIVNRYKRFIQRYPTLIGRIFYFFDFVWRRVVPKIPVIQKFYFGITQGKNRALSFAESLGRLYYCGFRVFDVNEIDNYVYFIAIKSKNPSTDKNPSYGPLFKMKRIGKNGKEIFVYKVRTMHPYSEYLQKFVYDLNELEAGGKLKNDFRISYWGAVFRKLWIDELPMFINFFKGDLKLVGVRPLSKHYLSLYDEELKNKRLKYKPGLVPPFYADMPKTLEEIQASEWKYLEEYEKRPFATDFKYFWRAFYNIVVKKARSA